MINLDNLGKKNADEKQTGPMDLVFAGAPKAKASTMESRPVSAIVDQHQKLIYLIDVSISMSEKVIGSTTPEMYHWTKEVMDNIRFKIAAAKFEVKDAEEQLAEAIKNFDPDDQDDDDCVPSINDFLSPEAAQWSALDAAIDDNDLKLRICADNLLAACGVERDYNKIDYSSTKLDLVKKMSAKMLRKRFEKYPDADVECIQFNNAAKILNTNTQESLMTAIAAMECNGGTNIRNAVEVAIKVIENDPSRVGVNHLVLVTDGEDDSSMTIPDLLEKLKSLGVTLDFIYIKTYRPYNEGRTTSADVLKRVCKELNGSYTEVVNAKEFETQFISSNLRLLTAGSK